MGFDAETVANEASSNSLVEVTDEQNFWGVHWDKDLLGGEQMGSCVQLREKVKNLGTNGPCDLDDFKIASGDVARLIECQVNMVQTMLDTISLQFHKEDVFRDAQ